MGPALVVGFGVAMSRLLTRSEPREIPLVGHSLPRRDSGRVVATSAALGMLFYLVAVVAAATGNLAVLP